MTSENHSHPPKETVKPLFTAVQIKRRIIRLAQDITRDFCDSELFVIGLLTGSFMFLSDLIRRLHRHNIPLFIDFMNVSSYGDGITSTGSVSLSQDVTMDVEGRPVLLVDDIIDTGRTLQFIHRHLMTKKPGILKTCVLLDKPARRAVRFKPDYVGFTVPDAFIVGYGLNYQNRYRELPYISILSD